MNAAHTFNIIKHLITSRLRYDFESASDLPTNWSQQITLPLSGLHYHIYPQPFLTEEDIANIEIDQVDFGQCLLFQFTPAGTQKLYQLSLEHTHETLFLLVNNQPLGFHLIDTPLSDDHIMMFVEYQEQHLPDLLSQLKQATGCPLVNKSK